MTGLIERDREVDNLMTAPSLEERSAVLRRTSQLFADPNLAASVISPRFVRKNAKLFHPRYPRFTRRGLEWLDRMGALVEIEGARVLDAGCGSGVQSMLLAIGGAASVVAVDRSATKIADLNRWKRYAGADRVEPLHGHFTESGRQFDLVLARCFLSHLPENDEFLSFCANALNPCGQLWIYDDNNAWAPLRRLTAPRLWWKAELFGAEKDEAGFVTIRRSLIRELLPPPANWLDRIHIELLAHRTRGLTLDEVREACSEIAAGTRPLPRLPRFGFRNPTTGVCEERLLSPGDLVRTLKRHGFRTILFPGTTAAGEHETWQQAARCLSVRAFLPEFELVAISGIQNKGT